MFTRIAKSDVLDGFNSMVPLGGRKCLESFARNALDRDLLPLHGIISLPAPDLLVSAWRYGGA